MSERQALFISHASPEDNAFTIWLGAKLAAAGYEVWADVLRLTGGDDWQRKLEDALRNRTCKVLLVANQKSVDKQGVRNEIQIASDVAKKISDTRFIIPLKLGPFDAPFLIAHAQYIDFSKGWSSGLHELMSALQEEYGIPLSDEPSAAIWSSLQAMHGRKLEQRSEQLVSNWLRVRKLPEGIQYYRNAELRSNGVVLSSPSVPYGEGFLTCEEHPIPVQARLYSAMPWASAGRNSASRIQKCERCSPGWPTRDGAFPEIAGAALLRDGKRPACVVVRRRPPGHAVRV